MISPLLDHAATERHIVGGDSPVFRGVLRYQGRPQCKTLEAETEDKLIAEGKARVAQLRADNPWCYLDMAITAWRLDISRGWA